MEMALVEIPSGKWAGTVFVIHIDPATDEPVTPFFISDDGRTVTDEHGNLIGERYATPLTDINPEDFNNG
jgi:hypothetical protein